MFFHELVAKQDLAFSWVALGGKNGLENRGFNVASIWSLVVQLKWLELQWGGIGRKQSTRGSSEMELVFLCKLEVQCIRQGSSLGKKTEKFKNMQKADQNLGLFEREWIQFEANPTSSICLQSTSMKMNNTPPALQYSLRLHFTFTFTHQFIKLYRLFNTSKNTISLSSTLHFILYFLLQLF